MMTPRLPGGPWQPVDWNLIAFLGFMLSVYVFMVAVLVHLG